MSPSRPALLLGKILVCSLGRQESEGIRRAEAFLESNRRINRMRVVGFFLYQISKSQCTCGWRTIKFWELELHVVQLCRGVERELERLSQASDEFCAPDYLVLQGLRKLLNVVRPCLSALFSILSCSDSGSRLKFW